MRGHIFISRPIRAFRRRFYIGRQQDAVKTAFNGVPLNINASARVAAAAKSGFLYNRVNKNANSSLIALMHWLETGRKSRTTLICDCFWRIGPCRDWLPKLIDQR